VGPQSVQYAVPAGGPAEAVNKHRSEMETLRKDLEQGSATRTRIYLQCKIGDAFALRACIVNHRSRRYSHLPKRFDGKTCEKCLERIITRAQKTRHSHKPLGVSVAAIRVSSRMLYGMKSLDPMVLGLVAITLIEVSAMACVVPAWRAPRLDPMPVQ
jgi:hypothetical protein